MTFGVCLSGGPVFIGTSGILLFLTLVLYIHWRSVSYVGLPCLANVSCVRETEPLPSVDITLFLDMHVSRSDLAGMFSQGVKGFPGGPPSALRCPGFAACSPRQEAAGLSSPISKCAATSGRGPTEGKDSWAVQLQEWV